MPEEDQNLRDQNFRLDLMRWLQAINETQRHQTARLTDISARLNIISAWVSFMGVITLIGFLAGIAAFFCGVLGMP